MVALCDCEEVRDEGRKRRCVSVALLMESTTSSNDASAADS